MAEEQRAPTEEELALVGEELQRAAETALHRMYLAGTWETDDDDDRTPEQIRAETCAARHALMIAMAKAIRETASSVTPVPGSRYVEFVKLPDGSVAVRPLDGMLMAPALTMCGTPTPTGA